MINLQLSLTNVKNESRLFKEVRSLLQKREFSFIQIVGLLEDGLEENSTLQKNIDIDRLALKSRKLSKNLFFQSIKYLEYMFIILYKYRNFNVVTIHSLGLLPIGVLYKFFNQAKLVYDAHEYETETQGLKGFRKKLSKILEKNLIKYCDAVIVVSDSIANEYVKLYNIPKPALVLNTPPYTVIEKKDLFREKLGIGQDKTIFLYQGGLSGGRGIEILLEAFKEINDDKSVIVFMGYGSLEDMIKNTSNNHNNIFFHPAVTPDTLLDYTSSADFGILFYENNCLNHYYCSPNKMFEYLMAEIPVIVSNLYEMRKLVKVYQVGIVSEENTSKGLRRAIAEALKLDKIDLQKNIQQIKQLYNWQEQEKVLLNVYSELI